jgi:hypothetical protein
LNKINDRLEGEGCSLMLVNYRRSLRKLKIYQILQIELFLTEFHKYLKSNGVSDSHQNNNLKVLSTFAHSLGPNISFLDMKENDPIISFLDSKLKDIENDPDRTSLVTWNDYLGRIKYFMRWLYNCRIRDSKEMDY